MGENVRRAYSKQEAIEVWIKSLTITKLRDKSNIFSLSAVQIDYVKAPQFVRLTQEQLDSDEDISQVMEFPDYVNQEIVNELVNLVMRKVNDPSLASHIQITQSIARPTGQQTQQA